MVPLNLPNLLTVVRMLLVSVARLQAWVAMVIIAREFAVTVLRAAVGAGQGVVISASAFGKAKTVLQVAMVLALIAVHGRPAWVDALIYLTVLVTVISGADYFFGLSRPEPPVAPGASDGGVEPRPPAGVGL